MPADSAFIGVTVGASSGTRSSHSSGEMVSQALSRINDSELIRAAQRGDRAAFETLVRQYDQAVLRLALHLTGSDADAHDIYQFTSKIDATFSPERKVGLIEELWRAAYSDSVLHEYEEHLIRRVADLLHLSHSQFIAAKLRVLAKASSGHG